jgi:hypothetical protein
MRDLSLLVACAVLLVAGRSARGAARIYAGGVLVEGEGNTLAGMARDVANPGLFSLENGRAVCAGGLWLTGELRIGPGESLVFENPQREWGRRLVYLLGRMDFRDCEIAGAYWIAVGPQASGTWRNVRIISGPNAGSGYPLIYYNSSQLEWDGGLLDAHPAPDVFTDAALSCRQGYHPGSVGNTIRNVTIRSRDHAFYDPSSPGVDVDLTFENCTFETSRADHAKIASWVNASDLGRTRVALKDCRRLKDGQPAPFDEIAVFGSAAEIIESNGGREQVHAASDLTALDDDPPHGIWHRLRQLPALRRRADDLAGQARLRGSLYMPRCDLEQLRPMRTAIGLNGRYGPGDAATVTRLMDLTEDTLDKAPLAVRPGGPYRPRPARLEWPPPGRAHIEVLPDGRVRVDSHRNTLYYWPGGPGTFARLTEQSAIRGRRVFDAFPNLGGPSLRHIAPSDSSLMTWELPWAVQVVQNDAAAVGFKATVKNAPAHGVEVTHVFFHDLADVILYDVASVQRDTPEQASVRFAAYANPADRSYNGMRFWSDDPRGVDALDNTVKETIAPGEPEHGLFVGRAGNFWMHPHLVRGALVAQWNGYNDWRRFPPAGYIIHKDECAAIYVNATGYYAHVVELSRPGQTRYQLLWFEGGGLRCWENIFNLDAAFNHPCQIAPQLEEGRPLAVEAVETAGLSRNVEIAIMPKVFNALDTNLPVFRGDSTIALLRDVKAGSRRLLGTLPVTLRRLAPGRFEIRSELGGPLADVEIRLRGVGEGARIRHGAQVIAAEQAADGARYRAEIAPGATEISVE